MQEPAAPRAAGDVGVFGREPHPATAAVAVTGIYSRARPIILVCPIRSGHVPLNWRDDVTVYRPADVVRHEVARVEFNAAKPRGPGLRWRGGTRRALIGVPAPGRREPRLRSARRS